jgi:uncharacterized protein (DUF362 family)
MRPYTVYLGACPAYQSEAIYKVLQKAFETIETEKPISGNVVIKPNLVMAHPKVATEGFTRKQVVEAVLNLVRQRGKSVRRIDIVEKSGLGVTTAGMYRYAGYRSLTQTFPVRLRAMEEGERTLVSLKNWKVHPTLHIAREMAERDFLIFVPKLKTNVLSHGYSGALKLNIGTIDSKERIAHHHRSLPQKIIDILEIANPDLIVTDGIRLAFGGNQMTQKGIDFGVIAVSTDAVAHDMICAQLLGLDPLKIEHIREAIDRGYGPRTVDDVTVTGDYPLSKGRSIVKSLDFGFQPVSRFKCNFTIISGNPYCTGGCHGIFLDWLLMVRDRKMKAFKHFPKITVFIGKVEKKINARHILLVGNCAMASSHLSGKRTVKIRGCPPTHKMIVLTLMLRYGLFAPLVRPSLIFDSFVAYPIKKAKGWLVNCVRNH